MSKEKVPIKIVVPIIVVTWVLSLISALAIVYMMPSLIPIRSEQIGEGLITSDKIADEAIITVKLADGNVTSAKILDGNITAVDIADSSVIDVKIADGAVSNPKLAANAIPFASTWNGTIVYTTNTTFEDMPETSVSITVDRPSHLIIMFSGEAYANGASGATYMRAMVNTTQAFPNSTSVRLTSEYGWSSYAHVFYKSVDTGTYTVKMEWRVRDSGDDGRVGDRTLNVIALPA